MKHKEGLKLRKLGREFIVVAEGMGLVNFNKMISLNSTAAYLWENVYGKDFTVEDLAKLLIDKYGIDQELANKDSASIAQAWKDAELYE